jgi:hypothetical protein
MFDRTLRESRRISQGVQVPIGMPIDDDGYLDRQCPADMCQAVFKVLFEDWRDRVSEEVVYCPICRGEAPPSEWQTEEQQDYIGQTAVDYVQRRLGGTLRQDAQAFNRRQPKDGFIRLSMTYKPGARSLVLPPEAAEIMQQHFVCEMCGCRYASVGAAFFCPACGHNSAASTFNQAIEAVTATVDALPAIRETLRESRGKDAAEDTARQLLENSLVKLVSSFQRYAEAAFAQLPNSSRVAVRKNVFQNLPESSGLWRKASGKGHEDVVTVDELTELNRLFQQRHLLSHREGIVDQEYIDRSGDHTYSVGQRLVVRESSVLRLARLVVKLANGLAKP